MKTCLIFVEALNYLQSLRSTCKCTEVCALNDTPPTCFQHTFILLSNTSVSEVYNITSVLLGLCTEHGATQKASICSNISYIKIYKQYIYNHLLQILLAKNTMCFVMYLVQVLCLKAFYPSTFFSWRAVWHSRLALHFLQFHRTMKFIVLTLSVSILTVQV